MARDGVIIDYFDNEKGELQFSVRCSGDQDLEPEEILGIMTMGFKLMAEITTGVTSKEDLLELFGMIFDTLPEARDGAETREYCEDDMLCGLLETGEIGEA